jgi:excisionase family DNA binding protein
MQPNNLPIAPQLLSIEQAGQALNIGRSKIYQLIRSQEIHTVKLGKRRLVPASEVQAFVARLAAA